MWRISTVELWLVRHGELIFSIYINSYIRADVMLDKQQKVHINQLIIKIQAIEIDVQTVDKKWFEYLKQGVLERMIPSERSLP